MLVSRPDHHTSIKESETVNVEQGRGCSARDAQAHVETVPKPQSSLWMVLPAVPIPEACRAASGWCSRWCPFPKPAEQPLDGAPGGAHSRSLQSSLWMVLPVVPIPEACRAASGWCSRRCPFPKPAEQPLDDAPGGAHAVEAQRKTGWCTPSSQ